MKTRVFLFPFLVISIFLTWGGIASEVHAQACTGFPPLCGPSLQYVCGLATEYSDLGWEAVSPVSGMCFSSPATVEVEGYRCRKDGILYCKDYYIAECISGAWQCAFDHFEVDNTLFNPPFCEVMPGAICSSPIPSCGGCGGPPPGAGCTPTDPSSPVLVSPADGATVGVSGTTLDWNPVSLWGNGCGGTNQYQVFMEAGDSTPDVQVATYSSGTTAHPTGSLTAGATYYWVIAATNGPRTNYSVVRSFTIPVFPLCVANTAISWTDPVLAANVTPIRKIHFDEMRTWTNSRRSGVGIGNFSWTDPVLAANVTPIRKIHVDELRTAISAVYVDCGQTVPVWIDSVLTANITRIRKAHIDQLRAVISGAPRNP